MEGRMLGLIVAGGPPLEALGIDDDAALTPFAGKYRFDDFALATLANSGVAPLYVVAPGGSPALVDHLGRLAGSGASRPSLLTPPLQPGRGRRRGTRLLQALVACRELARRSGAETVTVLMADHVL